MIQKSHSIIDGNKAYCDHTACHVMYSYRATNKIGLCFTIIA